MKRLWADLNKHATDIVYYEKKKMLPLTNKEDPEFFHICKEKFHDIDDNNDDSNDGEFDARNFYGDAPELDNVHDYDDE